MWDPWRHVKWSELCTTESRCRAVKYTRLATFMQGDLVPAACREASFLGKV